MSPALTLPAPATADQSRRIAEALSARSNLQLSPAAAVPGLSLNLYARGAAAANPSKDQGDVTNDDDAANDALNDDDDDSGDVDDYGAVSAASVPCTSQYAQVDLRPIRNM